METILALAPELTETPAALANFESSYQEWLITLEAQAAMREDALSAEGYYAEGRDLYGEDY
jgi:hypothetical protein